MRQQCLLYLPKGDIWRRELIVGFGSFAAISTDSLSHPRGFSSLVHEGRLLMDGQCDHLGSSPLTPLAAGNIRSTAPSHSFSAGSFSPARCSLASFTKAAGRESFCGFR